MCPFSQLILVCVLSGSSYGARVLGVIPTPSYSHQIAFRPLWKELSLKGHDVTLITTDPMRDGSLANLREIDVGSSYRILRNNISVIVRLSKSNFGESWKKLWRLYGEVYEEQLGHHEVKNLIRDESYRFDLVIAEYTHAIAYGFAKRFDCPFIGIGSMEANSYVYGTVGNPTHPILYPTFTAPYQGRQGFLERLYNVKYELFIMYMYNLYIPTIVNPIARRHFGTDYSPYDIARNASLILVNKSPIFQDLRPTVPAVVYFGGATHVVATKALPKVRTEV